MNGWPLAFAEAARFLAAVIQVEVLFGPLRCAVLPSELRSCAPFACAQRMKNSGTFGSNPIRWSSPPFIFVSFFVTVFSLFQSVVETSERSRPAWRTASRFTISVRWFVNSGSA